MPYELRKKWRRKWDLVNPSDALIKQWNEVATNKWEKGDKLDALVAGTYGAQHDPYNAPRMNQDGEILCSYWPIDKSRDFNSGRQHVMFGYHADDPDFFVQSGRRPQRIRGDITFRWGFKMKIPKEYWMLGLPPRRRTLFNQIHIIGKESSSFSLSFYVDKWQAVVQRGSVVETAEHPGEVPETERWYKFEVQISPDSLLVLRDDEVFAQRRHAWKLNEYGELAKSLSMGIYAVWAKDGGLKGFPGTYPQFLHFKDVFMDVEE